MEKNGVDKEIKTKECQIEKQKQKNARWGNKSENNAI